MKRVLSTLWGPTLGMCAIWLGLFALSLHAQTLATTTTLNGAINATVNQVRLTSATGVARDTKLWVNREQMTVLSMNGTLATVRRGSAGVVTAHDTADTVIIANESGSTQYFFTFDPDIGAACARGTGQARVLPWINTATGVIWNCRLNGTWWGTTMTPLTYSSTQAFTG